MWFYFSSSCISEENPELWPGMGRAEELPWDAATQCDIGPRETPARLAGARKWDNAEKGGDTKKEGQNEGQKPRVTRREKGGE